MPDRIFAWNSCRKPVIIASTTISDATPMATAATAMTVMTEIITCFRLARR